jgi:tRNA-dihydrouridine synthase B
VPAPAASTPLPEPVAPGLPLTALAPMQDVTDHGFMHLIARYGAPDYFFTEFFRVHSQSRPERHILHSIDDNRTGRPIFAQLIGEDSAHLERTVAELLRHPIAGIDLNLGCPAPKVYKKNVGGGLLRDPVRIDELLAILRAACPGRFTVKMRIGFDDLSPFDRVLDSVNAHRVDLLTVHGRTVKDGYRSEVNYDAIGHAVRRARCPVLANGNVTSADAAARILATTGAAGVMIGRHAIRNPWIFRQCRERLAGAAPAPVTLQQVFGYITDLYAATRIDPVPEGVHVNKMKKYLNFVGQGVDPTGAFLHDMRRTSSRDELFRVCERHLLGEPDRAFAAEPYPGVIARPNCETPEAQPDGCSLETVTA